LKACEGLLQGMSYWTFTDLFEEPGPPPTPFHGGFGLLNREGIRKPAFFAYKYLHALQGNVLPTTDGQAMIATDAGKITAVLWDFEQPEQKVSNRPFYTKVVTAHPAAPIQLRIAHLSPGAAYKVEVHRTGFHANDAYSAYLEMGSPKSLTQEQLNHLQALTRDLPEKNDRVRAGKDGTLLVDVPMKSNDIVLVSVQSASKRSR
jgi:xylan 1,4-beta-xylosidase